MQELHVNVSELTLTPLICATLINEIVKGLLFQKNQIPYPFDWLKSVVERKRKAPLDVSSKQNFSLESHFRVVATAYDSLQSFKKSLSEEFSFNGSYIKQVVIMLGDSPSYAKEVFRIGVSSLEVGHIERNHILEIEKHLQKILRGIFLSENLLDSIDASHNCMNTFIFIEKQISEHDLVRNLNEFQPCRPLEVHSKVTQLKINLNNSGAKASNCCGSLTVFDDNPDGSDADMHTLKPQENLLIDNSTVWYQFKHPIKGFKDHFKDKVSVSELW